jgi:ribose 5-phosphate isomerase B
MKIKIGIAADHRGFTMKELLKYEVAFGADEVEWHDVGCFTAERTDYPLYAHKIVHALQQKEITCAVVFCGSGVGMAIAANRFKGVYAGVAWNPDIARSAKEDDNVNVLSIPADFVDSTLVREIVAAWLNAKFKGGRYEERLKMIDSK